MSRFGFLFVILSVVCIYSTGCSGEHYSDAPIAEVTKPLPVSHPAGADTLPIDLEASILAWKGTKLWGRGMHTGTLDFCKGYLLFKNDRIVGGAITADMGTIRITDIPPDQPEPIQILTGHLENEVFFYVDKFPTATFKFTGVKYGPNGNLFIRGNLRIRDKERNIGFIAEPDLPNLQQAKSYSTRFRIDRFEWDIAYTGGFGESFLSPRNFVDAYIGLSLKVVPRYSEINS